MKTQALIAASLLTLISGVAHAENWRAVTTDANASYAIDADSLVKSNGKTAFTAQTIYTSKMTAPNNAVYNRATNTFLADCKAKTIALTGVKLIDGAGNVVFADTPTVDQAPVLTPEPNSLSAKILQAGCGLK
jgi:hypothetical protein